MEFDINDVMKFDITDIKSWSNRKDVKIGDKGYFFNRFLWRLFFFLTFECCKERTA